MLTTILLALVGGISFGILLLVSSLLYLIKINCPKCKQPKPLKEILLFHWKERIINGQPCQHCQRPRPQIDISL